MTSGRRAIGVRRGDVILVPFPFAELTATKARPAVVVSTEQFTRQEGKILVAAITSNVQAHHGSTNYLLARWKDAGLLKPSVITSWLATLSPAIILMKIGTLPNEEVPKFEASLRAAMAL